VCGKPRSTTESTTRGLMAMGGWVAGWFGGAVGRKGKERAVTCEYVQAYNMFVFAGVGDVPSPENSDDGEAFEDIVEVTDSDFEDPRAHVQNKSTTSPHP
jgi:hypothetical protein